MRVVLFDFCMNFGGASQGSLFLLSRLKLEGFKVSVIDAYGKDQRYRSKAHEYGLDFNTLVPETKHTFIGKSGYKRIFYSLLQIPNFINLLYCLFVLIRSIKPDVVIVNNNKSLFFISILKKVINFKILLYYRGEAMPEQLSDGFVKRINKSANAVITHSKKAYANLEPFILDAKSKLYFTPNCIDAKKTQKIIINNDFPTSENFTLLLAAARPVKEKGHDIAIKALAKLRKEGLIVDLVIPGSIPVGHSNKYYLYLKSLIEELSLSNQVKFIGWRSNLIGDLVQSDAVLLPSHTEGFPRSIIEAMLLGVPVCATPVGGIPEAVFHKKTGMLFEIDNVEQLSDCIRMLVKDIEFRNELINNARRFSADYFNPDNNTRAVSDLLRKL